MSRRPRRNHAPGFKVRVSESPGQDFGKITDKDFSKSGTAISLNRGPGDGSDFGSAVRAVSLSG